MTRAGRVFAWIFAVAFFMASVWDFLLSQQISGCGQADLRP